MAKQLMTSTQVACHLSLNITVNDNGNTQLVTLPLLPLTTIFFALWALRQTLDTAIIEAVLLADEFKAALTPAFNVAAIIFKSVAFGLGVPL
jgi:hypothetical protein